MAVKTKKEVQAENSELRERLNMVQTNFDKLSNEHKILKAELITEKEKHNRCTNRDKILESGKVLKNPKKKSSTGEFKCDQCKKEFDQEWKMNAHERKHKRYQCDRCDQSFEYQDILRKHKLVSHENTKLYCHFYNNEKTCPYDERCIFLHEDSTFCKYDPNCERDFCMFKHRITQEEQENIESYDVNNEVVDIIDIESVSGEAVEELENEESEMCPNESVNKTFHNPSQIDNTFSREDFMCEKCDFHSKRKQDLVKHKSETHNWCMLCFSSFNSQDKLKDHILTNHTE